MKKTSLILPCLFFLFCHCQLFAQFVSQEDAGKIAGNLFSAYSKTADAGDLFITEDALLRKKGEDAAIYVFTEKKGGFLLD